jgi:hypothetical protein
VVVVKFSKEWAQRATMVSVALLASLATFVGIGLLLPPIPPPAPPPPSPPLRALQNELRVMRARVKELEATVAQYRDAELALKAKKAAPRSTSLAPLPDASVPGRDASTAVSNTSAAVPDASVPGPAAMAAPAEGSARYQRQLSAFRGERRNAAWALAQERALRSLDEIHYFKRSRLVELECRASTCRVLAAHDDESARSNFREILVGFMPQLPAMFTRNADTGEALRTEVLLSREPLP